MSGRSLLEEDLEQLQGRLADEEDGAAIGRALFGGRAYSRRRVAVGRCASSLGGRRTGRPNSVIVKNISSLRRRADVVRLVRYIGRLDGEASQTAGPTGNRRLDKRADQDVTLFDGGGHVLDRRYVVSMVADGWRLDDHANLTEAARILDALATGARLMEVPDARSGTTVVRLVSPGIEAVRGRRIDRRLVARLERVGAIEAGDDGEGRRWRRVADLPLDERYRDVRVRHVLMTIPLPDGLSRQAVTDAAAATIRDTFERWGFPSIRATHRNHGKYTHVHIALRTDNDAGEHLPWDDRLCDFLRMTLADKARAVGISAEWRRRADRPEVVDGVEHGEVSLDERRSKADYRDGVADLPKLFRPLERLAQRTPEWFLRYGRDYVEREIPRRMAGHLSKLLGRPLVKPGPPEPLDVATWEEGGCSVRKPGLLERIFGRKGGAAPQVDPLPIDLFPLAVRLRLLRVYRGDVVESLRSFDRMRCEDAGLASWYLRHRPDAFGALEEGGARRTSRDCALRELVADVTVLPAEVPRLAQVVPDSVLWDVALRYAALGLARDVRRLAASHLRLASEMDGVFKEDDRVEVKRVVDAVVMALEKRVDEMGERLMGRRSRAAVEQSVAKRLAAWDASKRPSSSHQRPSPTIKTSARKVGRSRSSGVER